MIEFFKSFIARTIAAYLVFSGKAVPVPVGSSDTTILVLETEGSQVVYLSCRNIVLGDSSYNILLSKLFLWVTTKDRVFWTTDNMGSQIRALAEESFEKHKNPD
jgi:hypothetical protein